MQTFNFNDFLVRQGPLEGVELFELFDKSIIPKPVKDQIWVAGGAIRRTIANQPLDTDVDYFFKKGSKSLDFKGLLSQRNENDVEVLRKTDTATTYVVRYTNDNQQTSTIKVQEIKVDFYDSIEQLLNTFDFTICQFAYDGENLHCGDYSLHDLGRKRLVINNITYPVASLRRLIKYTQQGYYACQGTMTQFLETTIDNPHLLQNTKEISSMD